MEINQSTRSKTPLRAIRARCIDCSGGQLKEVKGCQFKECPIHSLRMGKGGRAALRPIRSFCIWCCSGQGHEVKLCPVSNCPLWRYRLGKRPKKCVLPLEIASREHVSEVQHVRANKPMSSKHNLCNPIPRRDFKEVQHAR